MRDGDDYVLNLEKSFTTAAGQADYYVLTTQTPGATKPSDVTWFIVDGKKPGITPGPWSWRFAHEFCEDLEHHARYQLDERPARALHSRATLYFGARHPAHARERVRPGDWLWRFRPPR